MDSRARKILNSLSPNKIIIPIVIGLGVIIFLLLRNDNIDLEEIAINISKAKIEWIIAAILVLLIRDLGYIYRIHHLTDGQLNKAASFFVIILWEFASAITPSVVGGTTVVVFIINKEGIAFGKSLAYVMLTAVLDNLFFVIASLSIFLFTPIEIFPELSETAELASRFPLKKAFFISISLIGAYTLFMCICLFIAPKFFKRFLVQFTYIPLPFFRRMRRVVFQTGNDIIIASKILKEKTWSYWVKAVSSTVFIWIARYFMLNCLIAAFVNVEFTDHFLILARQVIMWVVMLVSPTPGSTGTAEYAFDLFFGEFFSVLGLTVIIALFWRLLTYYAYLILGVAFLPRWVKRVFYKTNE